MKRMVRNVSHHLFGLREKEWISTEIRRPMCWFAIGVVVFFVCLFWGRSYEEIPNFLGKRNVYLEGNIVSKEYKQSSYGGYWQIVLKNVKMNLDAAPEDAGDEMECIEGSGGKDTRDSGENDTLSGTVTLEGKYLCQIEEKEETMLQIGQQILLSAKMKPWEEITNPGQFDLKKWYCSQGILGQFEKCSIIKQGQKYFFLGEKMWQLRAWLYECLQQELGRKDGSLIGAMLLGQKSELDQESKNLYQRNSISHILSISGLHLTLLGMGLFACLKHFFGKNNTVAISCMLVMVLYCIFTGNSISTIRATIMFSISFLAQILGRSYDSLSALGLAAILQLFLNPYVINNSSFLLTFLAVAGVTFVSPRLQEMLEVKKKLGKSFCVSLSAALVTLPVLLRDYGTYPWYSTILNLFIVPVMSILLGLSVLLIFFILLTVLWQSAKIKTGVIIVKILKKIVRYGVKILLSYVEICCNIFEKLPFQDGYLGSPRVWQILLYAGLLFLVIGNVWRHSYFCKKMILLSAVMLLTVQTKFGAEVVMLDVGQGDSIVIRNSNGNIYLADCGSSSVSKVGKYRLIPFLKQKGYGRIEGIFISHFDQDHMNGIQEMLEVAKEEKIRIVQLFLPESAAKIKADKGKLKEVLELAKKNKIRVVYLKRGDRMIDGKMAFFCLHPNTEAEEKTEQDRNNESLVLFFKYRNFKFLLTGDVEKEGEMEILQYIDSIGLPMKTDVLKVAHHGSGGSSCDAFLKETKPSVSLISNGRNNPYGHPHEETMERLEKIGSKILSTTESGAITLKIGRKIKVYKFKK